MKIVVIDNYDSFTYNLVEYLHKVDVENVDVYRNDEVEVRHLSSYDAIILSPGPGLPKDAGILMDTIKEYHTSKVILGICLGHQAIVEFYGGSLVNPDKVQHGITTSATRTAINRGCMHNLPQHFEVGHYHSWHVCEDNLPSCLEITSYDEHNIIMGVIHKKYNIEGIQFHPESVLTPLGLEMLKNWVSSIDSKRNKNINYEKI